jgi:hypothetical protein
MQIQLCDGSVIYRAFMHYMRIANRTAAGMSVTTVSQGSEACAADCVGRETARSAVCSAAASGDHHFTNTHERATLQKQLPQAMRLFL